MNLTLALAGVVVPLAGLEPALEVDELALAEELAADFGQAVPGHISGWRDLASPYGVARQRHVETVDFGGIRMGLVGLADCVFCGKVVDGDAAAIGLHGDPEEAVYIPFVQDLRTSGFRLVHPTCFAHKIGVQTLVDVIHEHDQKDRLEHMRPTT